MKGRRREWIGWTTLAMAAVGWSGCVGGGAQPVDVDGIEEAPGISLSESVRLAPSERVRLPNGAVLTFVEVGEDSRCPEDVVCVWEGNAEVVVQIRNGAGPVRVVRLGTALDPRFTEVDALRVHLDAVDPAPISTGSIEPHAYRATFRVVERPR